MIKINIINSNDIIMKNFHKVKVNFMFKHIFYFDYNLMKVKD